MKKIILLLLLYSGITTAFAQTTVERTSPTVIPASPQAQEFMKYIDFPVTYYSGIPDISIPIHTIETKNLKIPVSLSYHASGFKPNEKDGYVGQGWSLNAGNRISRTVHGAPDEQSIACLVRNESDFPVRDFNCSGASDTEASSYLGMITGEPTGYDGEYDVFYYGYPGGSGNFVYRRSASSVFNAVTLPYSPIKINTSVVTQGGVRQIAYIDIFDEHGNFYRYGKSIKSGADATEYTHNWGANGVKSKGNAKTSWLLTEIISADKADTVFYEYNLQAAVNEYNIPFMQSMNKTQTFSSGSVLWDTSPSYTEEMRVGAQTTFTQSNISKIRYKNHEVNFSYSASVSTAHTKLRLISIEIKAGGTLLRKVNLNQSLYSSVSPYWYKLNSVEFTDSGSSLVQRYKFQYYDLTASGSSRTLPTMYLQKGTGSNTKAYAVDFWGFYNGANGNTMLLAAAHTSDPYKNDVNLKKLFGTANRNSDFNSARLGVLQSVTYPTGGTTTYEYEAHASSDGLTPGGVRIKKITHNGGNTPFTRTYSYNGATAIGGILSLAAGGGFFHNVFKTSSYSGNSGGYTGSFSNSASPQIDINFNSSPVIYGEVTEHYGEGATNTGSIKRLYDTYAATTGNDIEGDFVFKDPNVCPWNNLNHLVRENYGGNIYFKRTHKYGNILEKEITTYDRAGAVVKKVSRSYSNAVKETLTGLLVKKIFSQSPSSIVRNQDFWKRNYTIQQLMQQLNSETVSDFASGKEVKTTTSYTYNAYNMPASETVTTSDGGTRKTNFNYPFNYTAAPYNEMTTSNILSPVIEKAYYKNTTLLKTEKTNYKKWHSRFFAPASVEVTEKNTHYTVMQFNDYNASANLLQYTGRDGIAVSFFWGYAQQYPVVKVVGETHAAAKAKLTSTEYANMEKGLYTDVQLQTVCNKIRTGTNAQVTSFTYKPYVGILTETDPNNLTTYYEYDKFGRLQRILDFEKKVLNQFEYNYVNP